jgi:hypothetical protein
LWLALFIRVALSLSVTALRARGLTFELFASDLFFRLRHIVNNISPSIRDLIYRSSCHHATFSSLFQGCPGQEDPFILA